jgi:hypothetical protein
MRTEYLFLRRMPIHYVAPPVCDTDFTGTGEPSIVLSTHPHFKVQGLFVENVGDGFRLRWNTVDGALCYNVYQLIGSEWVLVAECITDTFYDVNPGVYSVTVITREGESELSDPVNTSGGVGPAPVMTVVADVPEVYETFTIPGKFRFIRNGPTTGNFFVRFQLSGTATTGALNDYNMVASTTLNNVGGNIWEILAPDGVSEFELDIEPTADSSPESDETVIVSLIPTSNYATSFPDMATVTIKEGCPPETGTATPCDLRTPDGTVIGTISIPSGPSGLVTQPWATGLPLGDYEARYEGGAYKFDGNPDPGFFRIQQYKVLYPGSSASYWDQGGSCNDTTVAGVEACVPIGKILSGVTKEGTISLQFDGAGTDLEYPGGGVDPTFKLTRTFLYPTMPARVRIKNYNSSLFDVCPDSVPSGNPAWDGTFPTKQLFAPTVLFWNLNAPTNFSFNGNELSFARVDFFTSHPTSPTGCGWRVFIEMSKASSPFFSACWVGLKGVGDTPEGIYYRQSGCSTGPACLVIEGY